MAEDLEPAGALGEGAGEADEAQSFSGRDSEVRARAARGTGGIWVADISVTLPNGRSGELELRDVRDLAGVVAALESA